MRISDWSSDVCSSDLHQLGEALAAQDLAAAKAVHEGMLAWAWTFSIGAVLVCIPAAWFFRRTITDPYVATVIDMEALAAGNTGIEISRTHYEDCVGRLCRAMVTFRDAAVNQDQGASQEKAQQAIVAALGDGLQRMAQGQIDYRIETPFPLAFEKLRTDYNEAVAQLRQIMLSVAESADSINTGSNEISSAAEDRSEERRVGKECVSTWRSRRSTEQ